MILHWNYRNLQEIPLELLQNGDHVKEIYMKRNNLTSLPKDIGKLANLSNLYLIGNKISTLPSEIDQLPLIVLDLSQNLLTTIPPSVGKMKTLQQLLLTQNQLTFLPKELGQLNGLKFLELSGNMLDNIPEEIIQGLTSLEEFAIDGNPITHFPRCITVLQNLRYVSACKCNLLYLPATPFYQLINAKRDGGNFTPNNAVPQAANERCLSNFQLLFDSNPHLNYVPFWVLQLLGRPHLESFWCGFRINNKPPRIRENLKQDDPRVPKDSSSSVNLQLLQIYQNYHGVKIVLDLPWMNTEDQHILCFDEDLVKIHNETANHPLSLLEHCLRVVHKGNLHKRPHQSLDRLRSTTPTVGIVEPHFKYSSRSSVSDMSSYTSASDTLYDPPPTSKQGQPQTTPSSAMEIDGSNIIIETSKPLQIQQPLIVLPHSQPLLPLSLKKTLDQNVVTKCFSCLKPIFTETWLVVFHQRIQRERHNDNNNQNQNPHLEEEDQRLVQNANNDKLTISCIFYCSKGCRDKLNGDFMKHEIKFKKIK